MIIVNLVSCRQPRRPGSINSILTSQVEAVEVEAFLSSQGSRKGNVGKSTIVYPFVIHAHTLPILRIEKGANPWSMKAFAKILLVAIMCLECCYPELFSFCSPSRSILQTVGPHPFQCRGRTMPWRCSAIFFRNHAQPWRWSQLWCMRPYYSQIIWLYAYDVYFPVILFFHALHMVDVLVMIE
jgi:hypothetical protein